jgi:hypothetical protein
MHYLIVVGHTLQTKNRLERDVLEWLEKKIDRTLFKTYDLGDVKKRIASQVELLNQTHARCKPLREDWYQDRPSKDWILRFPFVTVHFYAQRND